MPEQSQTQPERVEHHLLLEFIFRVSSGFMYKRSKFPVQHVPFKFGVRITNILNIPFPGTTLAQFTIRCAPSLSEYRSDKAVAIRALNPNQSLEVWLGEMTPVMEGSVWVSCSLTPSAAGHVIKTFQKDENTGVIESSLQPDNNWGDAGYIQRQMELLQTRTVASLHRRCSVGGGKVGAPENAGYVA